MDPDGGLEKLTAAKEIAYSWSCPTSEVTAKAQAPDQDLHCVEEGKLDGHLSAGLQISLWDLNRLLGKHGERRKGTSNLDLPAEGPFGFLVYPRVPTNIFIFCSCSCFHHITHVNNRVCW